MSETQVKNERWREVERIFDAALEVEPSARAVFIVNACNGDAALRQEVESLLASFCEAGDFLASPADKMTAVKLASALRQKQNGYANGAAVAVTNERLGPYQLIRELAEGGMGTVWLARRADDQFQQQVAIKLLKAGANSEDLLHRFRHERQILAGLNHPNIARLLDGGTTTDGRPYFVMEYIEGLPIDEYCRQHGLSVDARLQLFRQVCAAVHYAHQNLVIHRDLKPSNIFVTEDGTPKLLDFGIAKLLQPDLSQSFDTITGLNPMTPAYASPEQVRGEKLTTASDVYSLGVVLYELLTGRSPYRLQANTFGELMRAVVEQEPERPSTAIPRADGQPGVSPITIEPPDKLRRRLAGDIDGIVLMALRKEEPLRYGSVEQFSEDIRRYLDGLPTLARKGTFGYRTAKYLRRNRIPVAAAALILLSLLGGIGATLRQARIALTAQARAEREQARADGQRQRAEGALATAEERRQQAEQSRNDAEQQSIEAEAQREQASEQRTLAEAQRDRAEQQEQTNHRLVYSTQMSLAARDWQDSSIEHMQQLLIPHLPKPGQPDLRGFEWYLMWALAHPDRYTLSHGSDVTGIAYSPDGKLLATASAFEVKLWDAATGEELPLPKELGLSGAAAFSLDGKLLATSARDFSLRLWDVSAGRELRRFQVAHTEYIRSLAFSPDGKTLAATSDDHTATLWEVQTGNLLTMLKGHTNTVSCVVFSSDGRKVATASSDETVKLWDVSTGKELLTLKQHPAQNGRVNPAVFRVRFSPDGKSILAVGDFNSVAVWDLATGQALPAIVAIPRYWGSALEFSPDGKLLATGGVDRVIRFWEVGKWDLVKTLAGHGNAIRALAFSPDGKNLASGGWDKTVKLWDLTTDANPLLKRIAVNSSNPVAYSPDGRKLVVGTELWDTANWHRVATFGGHTNRVRGVAFSSDGKTIASVSEDKTVRLWDAATVAERFVLKGHTSGVFNVAFSPDGKLLATGGDDRSVKLWEVLTGRELVSFDGHRRAIYGIAFSPDGKLLASGSEDSSVRLWDVAARRGLATLKGHTGTVNHVAFSPNGKLLATTSGDSTVKLWDVATFKELSTFKGHAGQVHSLAFSPDGKRLATGSKDETVRLWDVATGQELVVLRHQTTVWSLAFSPDGQTLVAGGSDRILRVWRAATDREVTARLH